MLVRVLGDLEVEVAGARAELGGPKPRCLLGLLVAAEGTPVPLERIVDQVWGEDPPARVEASLQTYVARLRRALAPEGAAQPLRTHAGAYSLELAEEQVDARRFVRLLREARNAAPDAAVEALTAALGLWRGEAYSGLPGDALRAEATRLDELRLNAVADLWDLRLRRGEHAEAVAGLEQLVRLHPLRERFWELLALGLYRCARQGDALTALRRARTHLAEELGVDPGPQLRRLEESILRQDPDLDAPAPPAPIAAPPVPAVAPVAVRARMLGREAAMDRARAALEAAAAGAGRVLLISGEPGIGKSRLTEELAAEAAARGFRTGRGGWEAEECPPLWGWSRALREALGEATLLDAAAGERPDAASVSFRQADLLLDALRPGPPALLVLDDVHWADTESLRLIRRVAAGLAGVPLVLAVAHRSAAAEIGEPVADLLAALARTDPVRLELTGLDAAAVAAWVADRTGREAPAGLVEQLTRRTDGNPFYLGELVRLLVAEGDLGGAVPAGVRDVVRQRVALVPAQAADLLRAAAIGGRSFDLAVLAHAAGAEPLAVEDAIEAARMRGLVDEEAPGRYRFTHALVRDALAEAVPAPHRARLHARTALAVEEVHAGRVGEHAAELAEHYRLAGPAYARSGWVFARRAAETAAARSAHDESLRLFREAARLQELDPTVEDAEREQVLTGIARALARVGRPVEAWAPAERAARLALGRGDAVAAAAALLVVTEDTVWGWRVHPDYDDEAIALWREVLAGQPAEDVLGRAHVTAALAVEHLSRPGSAAESTRLADEAIALVRRSGRRDLAALLVLRLAYMAMLRPDLLHHRLPLADEMVERAVRLGDPPALAAALSGRGQDLGELGRLAETHSDLVRADELARRHHMSQHRMVTSWCLALRLQLDEDDAAAERAIEEAEAFQATLAVSGNGIGLCQLGMLRDLHGRLPELEPTLRELRGFHPGIRELHALAMVRAGRLEELRSMLGPWREQPPLPFDYLWLMLSAMRTETWIALGDTGAATDLRAALTPYADRLAIAVPVAFRGHVRLSLGRLAAFLGDPAAARDHLERARAAHAALGLPRWVRLTEDELEPLRSQGFGVP